MSFLLAGAALSIDWRYGSFLSDEGYLWYGVQRVLAGEIPLRDFMSYEVGRYYLSAALLGVFGGKGIVALRATFALWMAIGLGLAVNLVAQTWHERRWTHLIIPTLGLGLWMVPRHKIFDITISIVIVAALAHAVCSPVPKRWFVLGMVTGLAAIIGQNHGLYAFVASCIVLVLLLISEGRRAPILKIVLAWTGGVVVGYLPVITMALFVPGYGAAQLAALRFILVEYQGTNLPLPVPWPWHQALARDSISALVVGVLFFALAIGNACLGVAIAVLAVRQRLSAHPLLVAAAAVSLPYTNVAFSRADSSHLAQAIAPFLIALLATTATLPTHGIRPIVRQGVATFLLALGCMAVSPIHPRYQAVQSGNWQTVNVDGGRLLVDPFTASIFASIQTLVARGDLQGDDKILALPYFPGLSAALNQKCSIWEIYALYPRAAPFQNEEIRRLAAQPPQLIVISRTPLDGRPELAYQVSHALVYQYVRDHYTRLSRPDLTPDLEFYLAKTR